MLIVKELRKEILGARVDKIYDYGKKLRIVLYKGEKKELLIDPGYKMYLTEYDWPSPPTPSNFSMFLRKYLMGKHIKDIVQRSSERIVEIKFEFMTLVAELFSREKGNVILIDEGGKILQPQEIQIWKDRRVIQKEHYKYPPSGVDLFRLDYRTFQKMASASDKNMVRFLAVDLGLGGKYAEEVCLLAEVDKEATSDTDNLSKVYRVIKFLMEKTPEPRIVYRNDKPVDVVPFPFKTHRHLKAKEFPTLNQAFDAYFTKKEISGLEEEKEEKVEQEKGRRKRILQQQEQALEKWKGKKKEKRTKADLIYKNYGLIESILSSIQKAMNSGLSWKEIKKRIEQGESEEAKAITSLDEHQGTVTVEVSGKELELDFRKSVEKNAEKFYEKSKKARSKKEKLEDLLEETEKKVEKPVKVEEKPKIVKKKKKKKRWYQKFRWFKSSTGQLVVAGKDATSNELLIKKHMEPTDVVLHADIQGSPFALVKTKDPKSLDTTQSIKEAGEFVASYSKAWQLNLGEVDVYWVAPEQVSKSPPAGQSLAKGSFMVRGKRNYLKRAETRLAVGIQLEERRVISGPVQAVSKSADYFVTIQPGYTKSQQLAEKIKNQWLLKAREEHKPVIKSAPLDEIQRYIPSGRGDLVKY